MRKRSANIVSKLNKIVTSEYRAHIGASLDEAHQIVDNLWYGDRTKVNVQSAADLIMLLRSPKHKHMSPADVYYGPYQTMRKGNLEAHKQTPTPTPTPTPAPAPTPTPAPAPVMPEIDPAMWQQFLEFQKFQQMMNQAKSLNERLAGKRR